MKGICTTAEYIAQGFKPEEVADIRMVDWLNIKRARAGLTERQERQYERLVQKLGI